VWRGSPSTAARGHAREGTAAQRGEDTAASRMRSGVSDAVADGATSGAWRTDPRRRAIGAFLTTAP
jgi:hypothetical protein